MKVTKKTTDRILATLPRFQKVLTIAKDRDLNESDTVSIITDMLAEVFGYDKYMEVTSELAVRGTYCDIAIKIGDKYQYMIECKAIGTDLKEQHIRQAIGYGANKGIQWIVLTNGIDWHLYRLRFEQPIAWDLVARLNILAASVKDERTMELLSVLAKEGVEKGGREELYEKVQCVNRFVIGALLQTETIASLVKRELKRLADGIALETSEIVEMLRESVLRRDLLEGEEAEAAVKKVDKFYRQSAKKPQEKLQCNRAETACRDESEKSISEQLLEEVSNRESLPDSVGTVN